MATVADMLSIQHPRCSLYQETLKIWVLIINFWFSFNENIVDHISRFAVDEIERWTLDDFGQFKQRKVIPPVDNFGSKMVKSLTAKPTSKFDNQES